MPANMSRCSWLGRPFKPLAVGLIIALLPLTINGAAQILGYPPLLDPTGDDMAIGIISALALVLMLLGWVRKSQALFEGALLLVVGAFVARATLVALLDPYPLEAMLPLSVAMFAAGAYVLERDGQSRGERW